MTKQNLCRGIAILLSGLLCCCLYSCESKPIPPAEESSSGDWTSIGHGSGNTSYDITVKDPHSGEASGNASTDFIRSVVLHDVTVTLHADAAPIIAALGKPSGYYESNSCAFNGLDKTYTYGGFVLMTYPDGTTDRVSKLVLTDDSVKTGNGLYIGMPIQTLLQKLGNSYTEESGSYSYTLSDSKLLILTTDQMVTSLQYIALNS